MLSSSQFICVCAGPAPREMMDKVQRIVNQLSRDIGLDLTTSHLCPVCVQQGGGGRNRPPYPVVSAVNTSDDLLRAAERDSSPRLPNPDSPAPLRVDSQALRCAADCSLTAVDLQLGAPLRPGQHQTRAPYDLCGSSLEQFMRLGKWTRHQDNDREFFTTELMPGEREKPRQDEFDRVRTAVRLRFFCFLLYNAFRLFPVLFFACLLTQPDCLLSPPIFSFSNSWAPMR